MKCPFCGNENIPGELFCAYCGASLDSSVADATQIGTTGAEETVVSRPAPASEGSNSTTLLPGSQLQNGRYVVVKLLGQGGMGAAVLARDTRVSNKRVVIKELLSDETDPEKRQEDVRNFEREVDLLAHLDHPLIPSVTDRFQEGGRYYMVQVYVPGENLEDRLERLGQPLPEEEALQYTSQVLSILEYLARQNPPIVHRDIKPANIIINNNDQLARLVDFGIARADVAKKTQRKQTTALGTPGYAPPEQYQGNADARSDLYALAATLHHLLTNQDPREEPPFQYAPVRSLNPALSPEIEKVLQRALTLDITKRYQNATAMKHDIDDILMGHAIDADAEHSNAVPYARGYSGTIPRIRSRPLTTGPAAPVHPIARPRGAPPSGSFVGQEQTPMYGSGQQQQMYEPSLVEREERPDNIIDFEQPWQRPEDRFAPPQMDFDSSFQSDTHSALVNFFVLLVVIGMILALLFFLSGGLTVIGPF